MFSDVFENAVTLDFIVMLPEWGTPLPETQFCLCHGLCQIVFCFFQCSLPDVVKHTPVDLWDQWTEELITNGDEENAQRTLSVAIALASPSDRSMRLMRMSNLKLRSSDMSAAMHSLDQVNVAQLRPDERELYDALRKKLS